MPGWMESNASRRCLLHILFWIWDGRVLLLNGHLLEHFDHHVAAWAGAGSFLAAAAIALLVAGVTPERDPPGGARRHPLDLRPAFRKPQAMSYILAYFAHTFELFAYRGWSFALFAFLGARVSLSLSTITTLVSLLTVTGMAASIIGARYCLRYGRHRVISLVGMSSAVMALICALLLEGPVWLALAFLWIYNIFIMLDSGALTAGTVAAADQHDRGALLAVHSMVGFTGGALGGPAVGLMLDIGGGADSMNSWFLALLVMGAGSALVGIIQAVFWWRRDRMADWQGSRNYEYALKDSVTVIGACHADSTLSFDSAPQLGRTNPARVRRSPGAWLPILPVIWQVSAMQLCFTALRQVPTRIGWRLSWPRRASLPILRR